MPETRGGGSPQGLVDIEFAPLELVASAWTTPLLVGLLLLGGALLARWLGSPRARASRALARLRRRLRAEAIDERRAAFELAVVLRRAFAVSAIREDTPLPPRLKAETARWRRFNQRLADARYATPRPTRAEMEWLCTEAHHWLRRWLGHWPGYRR